MATLQKMLSEIRELEASEYDEVGGMGNYGPYSEPTQYMTFSDVGCYTDQRGVTHCVHTQDDACPD